MIKASRIVYLISSWIFLAAVAFQVFLAGMVVVAGEIDWASHRDLGHAMGLPLIIMVLSVYLGRMPRTMKRLTWLLFVVYILQADVVIFLRDTAPIISALHPVLALADVVLAVSLARRAWHVVRQPDEVVTMHGNLDPEPVD